MSDRRIDRRCWLRLCALLAMSVGLLFSAVGSWALVARRAR